MLPKEEMQAMLFRARSAPCIESLRLELVEIDRGGCRLLARHDPRFDGLLPGFHGGMQAAVADCAAWFAIVSRIGVGERLVTTDLQLRYLAPCLSDLFVAAQVVKIGRTLCPVRVDCYDVAEKHVATGSVTYMRVDQLGGAMAPTAGGEAR